MFRLPLSHENHEIHLPRIHGLGWELHHMAHDRTFWAVVISLIVMGFIAGLLLEVSYLRGEILLREFMRPMLK